MSPLEIDHAVRPPAQRVADDAFLAVSAEGSVGSRYFRIVPLGKVGGDAEHPRNIGEVKRGHDQRDSARELKDAASDSGNMDPPVAAGMSA